MTKHLTILILVGLSFSVGAQQLTKEGAIKIVMENNFDLAIADNAVKIAENNTSLLNSGYLPTLTGSAGATYNSEINHLDPNVDTLLACLARLASARFGSDPPRSLRLPYGP